MSFYQSDPSLLKCNNWDEIKGNCTHMWYPHQKSVSMFNCPFLNDCVVGKSILSQIQLVLPRFNFWNSLLTCIFLRTCLQCFGQKVQKVIQHQGVFWPDHPKTEDSFGQTIKNQKTETLSQFFGPIYCFIHKPDQIFWSAFSRGFWVWS